MMTRTGQRLVFAVISILSLLAGCVEATSKGDPVQNDTDTFPFIDSESDGASDADSETASETSDISGTDTISDSETASDTQDDTEGDGGIDGSVDTGGDPDPCTDGTDNCSEHATCTPSDEGFECECHKGYLGNGVTCLPSGITGLLTSESPGHFQDGFSAGSCAEYRNPPSPYLYSGSTGDGFYLIDPDGDGDSKTAFCDMTTNDGGWTLIAHVRREAGMPTPGCEDAGGIPTAIGYAIDATGIGFTEIAVTHNGLSEAAFASFVLNAPTVFACQGAHVAFLQSNGRYSILFLSAATSGTGDIPLACFNAADQDCLSEDRTQTYGAVSNGTGNCRQLNDGTGTETNCGGWGLAPHQGDTTWSADGGRILIR